MNVLIFGYVLHGGGFETSMYFLSRGDNVTVTDTRSRDSLGGSLDFLESKGAVIHCGELFDEDFRNADLVIKHPTLRLDHEKLALARRTENDLSYAACRPEPRLIKLICVTGLHDKTITTSAVCHALNALGHRAHMCGNMGLTAFSELRQWEKGHIPEYLVVEMSSWLARDTYNLLGRNVPHVEVSVITSTFDSNAQDGSQPSQSTGEFNVHANHIICPSKVKDAIGKLAQKNAKNIASIESASKGMAKALPDRMRASYAVLRKLGFSSSQANMALKSFRGIPGRNELVLHRDNAMFVNDSSSVIPAATNFTMENFENLPVHLICGGSDSSLDAKIMLGSLKGAASVHLLGGSFTEKNLIPLLRRHRIKFCGPYEKMEEAVYSASSFLAPEAQILQVVLLSPGSGAYEYYPGEFLRGEAFRKAVLNLQDR